MFDSPLYDHAFKILLKYIGINDSYARLASDQLAESGRCEVLRYVGAPAQNWDSLNSVIGPKYAVCSKGNTIVITMNK